MHLSKEWGNSVWTFFHIIAFRIDENKYHIVKDDIINITKLICSNLPCQNALIMQITYLKI